MLLMAMPVPADRQQQSRAPGGSPPSQGPTYLS